MKAVVVAFNQKKALVGAFSVLTNLRMELLQAALERAMIFISFITRTEVKKASPSSLSPLLVPCKKNIKEYNKDKVDKLHTMVIMHT